MEEVSQILNSFKNFDKHGAMLEVSDRVNGRILVRLFRDVDLIHFGNHLKVETIYKFNLEIVFHRFSIVSFFEKKRFLNSFLKENIYFQSVERKNSYVLGLKHINDVELELQRIFDSVFVKNRDTLLEIKYN